MFLIVYIEIKYLRKYLKFSSSFKSGITPLFTFSFGLVRIEVVFFFMMPNVSHLSTLIIISIRIMIILSKVKTNEIELKVEIIIELKDLKIISI